MTELTQWWWDEIVLPKINNNYAACGDDLYDLSDECKTLWEAFNKSEKFRQAVIDATVVDWVYKKEHDDDPRKAINDLCCMSAKIALDPAVSEEAAALRDTYLAELNSYKKAKAENDERFMIERDEARAERDVLKSLVRKVVDCYDLHGDCLRSGLLQDLRDALKTAPPRTEAVSGSSTET